MTLRVNGIEYCHQWQTSYSSHLEAVIIFSFLGEVGDVLYGGSSGRECLSMQELLRASLPMQK